MPTMPDDWRPPVGLGWDLVPRKLWPQIWATQNFPAGSLEFRDAVRTLKDWNRDRVATERHRSTKRRRKTADASRRRNRR